MWAVSPSFLQVLFQYRHLFRAIAARNLKPNFAVPTIVCWADIILAKLGDLSTFLATDFHAFPPSSPLPDILLVRQQEDNTRAAVQLPGNANLFRVVISDAGPDNWDMLPSLLGSARASPAAKRLTVRLLYGCHVLFARISGKSYSNELSYVTGAKLDLLD